MRHAKILPLCLLLLAAGPVRADDAPKFELVDGDRVVFVGNTFIERDQVYGYLETMLTARWPDRNIAFRNLGWSGDTVWGEARARFGTAADGFQHLKEHIESIKPTVIFIGYGANEAFEGEAGLPRFEKGLNTLLDMVAAAAAPNSRVILLSPLRQENLGSPLPDAARHNEVIERYANAIHKTATERSNRFVDLHDVTSDDVTPLFRVTENGIHLTALGYWSGTFKSTGKSFNVRFVHFWILRDGKVIRAEGISDTVPIVRAFEPGLEPASN